MNREMEQNRELTDSYLKPDLRKRWHFRTEGKYATGVALKSKKQKKKKFTKYMNILKKKSQLIIIFIHTTLKNIL